MREFPSRLEPDVINTCFPVSGLIFYPCGVVVKRSCVVDMLDRRLQHKRGQIGHVSRRSLSNMVLRVSNCGVKWLSLLTLTYGQNYPVDGRGVKRHLNHFLLKMKRSFGQFSYFWFLEFQRRGAPHVHLALSFGPSGVCERELVAEFWSAIVEVGNWPYTGLEWPYKRGDARIGMNTRDSVFRQHRRDQTWGWSRSADGVVRYAVKYATKLRQKYVPLEYRNVGRFWAGSRDVRLPVGVEVSATEKEVREVMAILGRNLDSFEVLPKIIFHNGNLPEELKVSTISD